MNLIKIRSFTCCIDMSWRWRSEETPLWVTWEWPPKSWIF